MTKEELSAKVEWEGGLAEAIFGYGLSREDLPEDAPTWVRANWEVLMNAKGALRRVEEWLGDDPEGGSREPAGDSPDSPPAGKSGLPGGSDDYFPVASAGNDPADLWEHITPVSPDEFIRASMPCRCPVTAEIGGLGPSYKNFPFSSS